MEDQSSQILKGKEAKNKSSNQNESNNNQEINADKIITESNIVFLEKNNQEPSPENINNIQFFPQDTASISTGTESNNSQQSENSQSKKKSFAVKTKEWAGNMWSSLKKINFKNMFAKAEFKEFRNANGDIVRIPVKKIPLKKKKGINENVKNMISKEKNKDINDYNDAATGMYLMG